MHRKTRILFCRIGFVLLCVLPTTVVAGWIVSRSATGYSAAQKAEWERELTSRLGLVVEIGEVAYPHPHVARLSDLKLLEPETRRLIASAAVLEIALADESWTASAELLSIEAAELATLARTLEHRLLRGQTPLSIRWLPCDAIVRRGDEGQTLCQVGGRLQCGVAESQFDLQFTLAGQAGSDSIRLHARRARNQGQPATEWRLDTASRSPPLWLAAAIAPELSRLGSECTFRGTARIVQEPNTTTGELTGQFESVDLDALVTEHFPHQLSGLATVQIERAQLARGKLVEGRGRVQAQEGALSYSLIAAAQQHLGLEADPELSGTPPAAAIPFTQLALGFHLSGASLSLAGSADPARAGTLIASEEGPLLIAPPDYASTGAALLRTLLPDSQHQVPATRQTDAIIRWLPLPEAAPLTSTPQAHTPTRLAPAQTASPPAVRQPVVR